MRLLLIACLFALAGAPRSAAAQTPGAHATVFSDSVGAVARCKDGTYSHARNPLAACATHQGVARWLGIKQRGSAPPPAKKSGP